MRSTSARGSIISRPQPWQRILKSMPHTQHIKTVWHHRGAVSKGLDHIADLYIHGSTPPFLC